MIETVIMFCIYFFGLILIIGVPLSIFEYFDEKALQESKEQSVREYSRKNRGKFDFSVDDIEQCTKNSHEFGRQTVIYKSHLLDGIVIEK